MLYRAAGQEGSLVRIFKDVFVMIFNIILSCKIFSLAFLCLSLLDLINVTTIIVHHFDVFHTLEDDKKKYDALVDILIKLTEKNLENLPCMVVHPQ
jgi:hypothetical protein